MNGVIIAWGVGLLVAALLFMARNDMIGYIGGGILAVIGVGLMLTGWTKD